MVNYYFYICFGSRVFQNVFTVNKRNATEIGFL